MSALHREHWFSAWLVMPGALILLVLWLLPLAILLQLAFDGGTESLSAVWYLLRSILQDDHVREGLLAQSIRLVVAVSLEMLLGLMLARLVPLRGRAAGLWCAVLGICLLSPLVVSMMGWGMLFHPAMGPAALWSAWPVGISEVESWWMLEGMYLLRDLWQWVPLFALLCVARLRHLETFRYRAVQFDGGSGWTMFRQLEWPWLRGMLALGLALRLLVGAIVDVNFFNAVSGAEGGQLAQLSSTHGWLSGVSSTVPEHAPLSWLLPALMASADELGSVPVANLTACLGLIQAMLVLPLMLMLLWLICRGSRHGMPIGPSAPLRVPEPVGPYRSLFGQMLRWAFLAGYLVFALMPHAWLAWLALQVQTPGHGEGIGLGNFMALFDDQIWRASLMRTLTLSALTSVVALLLAIPMAYSFSRRLLAGDRLMSSLLMISLMMPAIVLAFPLVHIHEQLGWLGMPWAVGMAHLVFAVPLAVWVLAAGMAEVPTSLDEMAMKDGFRFMRFMTRVMLPLIRHRLWGAFLACFLLCWAEFLFARVLGSVVWPPFVVLLSESMAALPFDPGETLDSDWRLLAAASCLMMLPVVMAAYLLREQLPDMFSLFRVPCTLPNRRVMYRR